MSDVTIRPRALDDDPRIVAIRNEASAHFPPMSVDEYRYQADPANQAPNDRTVRYVAELDRDVVGLYSMSLPASVQRPGTVWASIGVAAEFRGRGVGGKLYDHMQKIATDWDGQRIYGYVREDDEHARQFVEHRGFTYTGRAGRMSRLDVHQACLDGYEDADERVAHAGLRITTVAAEGVDNEPFLRAVHHVTHETAKDIPASEEFTEEPFEIWRRWVLESPGSSPDRIWVAMDGDRPVGFASLPRRGDNAAFNGYTGVDREYRGKGVARALKLRTIEYARRHGIDYIYTGNDVDNTRMLDINIRLGYQPLPSGLEVVKELAPA